MFVLVVSLRSSTRRRQEPPSRQTPVRRLSLTAFSSQHAQCVACGTPASVAHPGLASVRPISTTAQRTCGRTSPPGPRVCTALATTLRTERTARITAFAASFGRLPLVQVMVLGGLTGGLHGEAVRPTRGADNLFLISRASFSAHSPYAHLDGHHQEGMHAKVTVLKRSPQTFLAGMHAQLRPIGGRSEPDFSLYNDRGMRISAFPRACTRPR